MTRRWRSASAKIFVHYGSGIGRSKLRIPAAKTGTMRNMNTIAKLAELGGEARPAGGREKREKEALGCEVVRRAWYRRWRGSHNLGGRGLHVHVGGTVRGQDLC